MLAHTHAPALRLCLHRRWPAPAKHRPCSISISGTSSSGTRSRRVYHQWQLLARPNASIVMQLHMLSTLYTHTSTDTYANKLLVGSSGSAQLKNAHSLLQVIAGCTELTACQEIAACSGCVALRCVPAPPNTCIIQPTACHCCNSASSCTAHS
jgi:hypothetical protein